MFLSQFHTAREGRIQISAEQASRFAKEVAGDFNPLHDVDSKRFCVPGDLLFALTLARYGLSEKMSVSFSDMVGRDTSLILPENENGLIEVKDDDGKLYMQVEHSGEVSHDPMLVEAIAREYVAFSGHNFPYVMVPILEKHGVMFNPRRPLVIYESMSFTLERLDIQQPKLKLAEATLDISGKRGDTHFLFDICDGDECVGRGDKKLLLGGLIPYDESELNLLIDKFKQLKTQYAH